MQITRHHGPRRRVILALLLLPVTASLIALACSGGSADPDAHSQSAPNTATEEATAGTGPESILHHWQALTAIRTGNIADAAHHVGHIIDLVTGDHAAAMRTVLQDLRDGRLHDAEHTIETMLADEAEPTLSPGMIHLQLTLAALGRESRPEALHHLGHFIDTGTPAGSTHGREALDALTNSDPADAMLHLRLAAQVEAEALRDVERCSGLGLPPTGIRDGTITLLLVLDEEWGARFGDDAELAGLEVVAQAQAALSDLGIVLDVAGIERWASPPNVDLHELSHAAASGIDLDGDAMLLAVLSDQATEGPADGAHQESAGAHAISVRHHRARPAQDALVLVHEIGHLLDLTHSDGTYMQAKGFADRPHWSPCQKGAVARLLPGPTR